MVASSPCLGEHLGPDEGGNTVSGHFVEFAVEVGVAVAVGVGHAGQDGLEVIVDLGQVVDAADHVVGQVTPAAQEHDIVVEGGLVTALELDLFGPVQSLVDRIVMGLGGPVEQVHGFVAQLGAVFVAVFGFLLELLEQLVVIVVGGIVVFDVAVIGEEDIDAVTFG